MVQTVKLKAPFGAIEEAFAQMIMQENQHEPLAYFAAYLFYAAKKGHIATLINETLYPDFEEIGPELKEMIRLGVHSFKESSYIIRVDNVYYLTKNYLLEQLFAKSFNQFMNSKPYPKIDPKPIEDDKLLERQKMAITQVLKNNLLLLTGGPGTGKTFTAVNIIKYLWHHLSEEQKKDFEIAVAAPTGKASSHLFAGIESKLSDPLLLERIRAKTLHSLLEEKKGSSDLFENPRKKLSADLIIIDESSMIDLKLMSALFLSLKEGVRVVLIGDRHQLPPIDSGSVFADLCELGSDFVVELNVPMRSDLKSIITLSSEIKSGVSELLFQEEFRIAMQDEEIDNQQIVLKEMQTRDFNSFRVLSPIRKGPLGIETLNNLYLEQLKKKHQHKSPFVFPIIFTKNDYRREVFNGESALLHFNKRLLPTHIEAKGKIGPLSEWPPFELAYCMSIHKSQGSEFEHVLVILPTSVESYGKEILYTAVTRAKKSVKILAHDEMIRACLKKDSRRYSTLLHSLSIQDYQDDS